jgi:hypothetical protein
MTIAEKDTTINLYGTWNKSSISRPKILSNNFNCYNSHENFSTESLLKQKMCSNKNYTHTSLPSNYSKPQLLQKPRVYTNDDRNLPIQSQNILSSSSGSSTLSFKDKNVKEVGETRYIKQNF